MFATRTEELRAELLALNGIGPETADGILLYAGHHEIFVVDAYARRVLSRHSAVTTSDKYDEVRRLVERSLHQEEPVEARRPVQEGRPQVHKASPMSIAQRSPRAQVYNEMHGLLVQVGKYYCLKQQAKCEVCPLGSLLPISIEVNLAGRDPRKTKAEMLSAGLPGSRSKSKTSDSPMS